MHGHGSGLEDSGLLVAELRVDAIEPCGVDRDGTRKAPMQRSERPHTGHRHQYGGAVGGISSPAASALSAGRRRADTDAVTHLEPRHALSEGRHAARPLRVVGIAGVERVEVGSADAAVDDLDHRLAGLGYGLRKLLELDPLATRHQPNTHGVPPLARRVASLPVGGGIEAAARSPTASCQPGNPPARPSSEGETPPRCSVRGIADGLCEMSDSPVLHVWPDHAVYLAADLDAWAAALHLGSSS